MSIKTFDIVRKIRQKSRLGVYRELLIFAQKEGYIITSLIEWFHKYCQNGQRVLILRHDVDIDTEGAAKMYAIEKSLGVHATYYFRWKTVSEALVYKMRRDGFEASLHYETLATYCKKHNIKDAKRVTDTVMKTCFNLLEKEISRFKTQFGGIQTIASHGDKRNRILGIPNHAILKYGNRADLDIQFEAYDPEITMLFDAYISDSSITNNFNWKYGLTPQEAIRSHLTTICLLTHPEHWNFNFKKNMKTIITDICERLS
ncbi:MAG TPA: hypothetical protein P5078_02765 [Candidatus Marinimicrobia bacterium]|nr:hypothetical protein [Candidatus Neomarinimicrobiota bacterium]HPD26057.1 hypothetical protein [Candidatus Neomarinimicrobiota bacterium]HRU46090.1 hypothetical protein [Candidatus Neomarinimicrobiota bacterium]